MYTCRGINIGRKTRRIHLYTVLLMVYFVMAPFEDLFTSERGTVAKYLGMMIIVVSMVEGWRLMKLRFTSDVIALIWLMFLGVLSCLWAIDVETAVSRNVAYLLVPGLFLFVNALTFSEREYEAIVKAAIVGGVAASIYVLTQSEFHGNSGRIILTEGNDPNNLAALLLLPLSLSARLALEKKGRGRILQFGFIALFLYVIFMTGSRGGLIAIAALGFCFFLFSRAYRKPQIVIGLVVVIICVAIFVLPALPEEMRERLFNMDLGQELENGNRVIIWQDVFNYVLPGMSPFGLGAGCAPVALENFYGVSRGVHNTYLTMICEYGILGIGFFLWFLFIRWKRQMKRKHYMEAALLVAMCVTIFFLDSYFKKFLWNVLMILVINEKMDAGEKTKPAQSP